MNTIMDWELGQLHNLTLLQTQIINVQNNILHNLEEQIVELRRMVVMRTGLGRSLGDPIVVEDDVVIAVDELLTAGPQAGLSRQVVMTFIKIKD